MALDLATAEKIAKKGLERAREMGLKVSFAVVDDSGNLVYVARMDGAPFFSPNIAMGKAWVSSAWQLSSAELENRAKIGAILLRQRRRHVRGRAIVRQGALPITIGGQVVGAAGVSGGTSTEDEEIVMAGLAALQPVAANGRPLASARRGNDERDAAPRDRSSIDWSMRRY